MTNTELDEYLASDEWATAKQRWNNVMRYQQYKFIFVTVLWLLLRWAARKNAEQARKGVK